MTVLCGGTGYEVTTFRVDGVYEDGRHPKEVTFTPSLREDLKRRDFTINAMAYNNESGLVDLFGGQKDLENGIVRAVGGPRGGRPRAEIYGGRAQDHEGDTLERPARL